MEEASDGGGSYIMERSGMEAHTVTLDGIVRGWELPSNSHFVHSNVLKPFTYKPAKLKHQLCQIKDYKLYSNNSFLLFFFVDFVCLGS
uniref:Uncharacterized protein n=1 Tax=Cucumis melo TaxID=3656 RepID=A0A9I9EIX4_CUCME